MVLRVAEKAAAVGSRGTAAHLLLRLLARLRHRPRLRLLPRALLCLLLCPHARLRRRARLLLRPLLRLLLRAPHCRLQVQFVEWIIHLLTRG